MKWYVKNSDGKVFGPVDDAGLLSWVRDGRVEPFAGISTDLKKWKLASLEPNLEMDWIVENEPGRFYGPTHRDVVDDLIKSGSLSETCRIYRDDHGGASEKEAEAARSEAEKSLAQAEMAVTKKDAELAAAQKEVAKFKARAEQSEARVAELEAKIAKLTETKKREWKAEVVEPEIVSDEPPPAAREILRPGRAQTLADLERQAQAELARMGAAGAKKFFGLKR